MLLHRLKIIRNKKFKMPAPPELPDTSMETTVTTIATVGNHDETTMETSKFSDYWLCGKGTVAHQTTTQKAPRENKRSHDGTY